MIERDHVIILTLIIVILAISAAIINISHVDNTVKVNGTVSGRELIAEDDVGTVGVIRNIGNPGGSKIAYVVGVHPLENETHRTLLRLLPQVSDLNHCYDIYIINVTRDVGHYGDGASDDSPGRQNGQNLAKKYVYPGIIDGDYELAVDVHSNVGAYECRTFVFSPVKEAISGEYAKEVSKNSQSISYYAPESTTSGPFLTIPLNENGVPAFYFEEYSFAPQSEKDSHMLELIHAVDNLDFK